MSAHRESFISEFESLPEQTTHEYEMAMNSVASKVRKDRTEATLERLWRDEPDLPCRYHAFYCHCTVLRTNRNYTQLEKIMRAAPADFRTEPSFRHLTLLARVGLRNTFSDEAFLADCLEDAQAHPDSAGYLHMFAGAYAAIAEDREGEDAANLQWLREKQRHAYDAARRATQMDQTYAKFHATYGRIQSLNGEYSNAARELAVAIDLEDSRRSDYPLRLMNYESYRIQNQLRATADRLIARTSELTSALESRSNDVSTAVRRIESSASDNLQSLAFFAAVISFIVGSIQISTKLGFHEAVSLLVVLSGTLLMAFTGLSVLFGRPYPQRRVREIATFLIGVTLVLFGVYR